MISGKTKTIRRPSLSGLSNTGHLGASGSDAALAVGHVPQTMPSAMQEVSAPTAMPQMPTTAVVKSKLGKGK